MSRNRGPCPHKQSSGLLRIFVQLCDVHFVFFAPKKIKLPQTFEKHQFSPRLSVSNIILHATTWHNTTVGAEKKNKASLLPGNAPAKQACSHTNNVGVPAYLFCPFDAHLVFFGGKLNFFLQHIEEHLLLFSSRLSACPTRWFASQVGTIQRSDQHRSGSASFTAQACIHMNNRRGCSSSNARGGCTVVGVDKSVLTVSGVFSRFSFGSLPRHKADIIITLSKGTV